MVCCGSPELPDDSDDKLTTNGVHITNYGQNVSDDSDDEGIGTAYDGYEPLPLGETEGDIHRGPRDSVPDRESSDPHFPPIVSSDNEIAQQVWSLPRPPVLDLELDSSTTEQIMSAMANVTLPTSAIPDWAQAVPEERWKQDLLDRIRQRRDGSTPTGEGSSKNSLDSESAL